MPEFEDTGKTLGEARKDREATRLELLKARELKARLQAARKGLARGARPGRPAAEARRAELDRQEALADRLIAERERRLAGAGATLAAATDAFLPFSDPRERLSEKASDTPILLFPLRLETRFKRVEVSGNDRRDELWLRVYPDDCVVDSFEEIPSESELLSARKFWTDWAVAGGEEPGRRGAWASLVAGSGAGRAAWLIGVYRPVDLATLPVKAAPQDIVLALAYDAPLATAERAPVATYWSDFWRADGDAAAMTAAFDALQLALGADRAQTIATDFMPANLDVVPPAPMTKADVAVSVAFLEFPDAASIDAQRHAWSNAPRIHLMPERLVLIGYQDGKPVLEALGNPIPVPLIVGPDPLAAETEQIHLADGDLVMSPDMRWMVDFDEAVRIGMGFRIPLTAIDARRGFDELIVLGVSLSADAEHGQELVETLFHHHHAGTAGFALLPQGTPTNNTEGAGSGFSELEDADDSFDTVFGTGPVPEPDLTRRSDGEWLADALGLDLATFALVDHADGRDQCEARAMNRAMWPATAGYMMESMLKPVFDNDTIEKTRWFFNNFVLARGAIPAIRIADQPYGILPVTAFSRMRWLNDDRFREPDIPGRPRDSRRFLIQLDQLLRSMRADWSQMAANVDHVGQPGDPHQTLLDALGLHATSAEYYQRYAESLEQLTNRMKLEGAWGNFLAALIALFYTQSGMQLLQRFGYKEADIPELLEKFFLNTPNLLTGDLIDDQELSETAPIRAYAEDGRNYLRWLIDAARTSFETLRRADGFPDSGRPQALLYLMLRYALEQSYFETSLLLLANVGDLNQAELAEARIDPSFIHVAETGGLATATATAADLQTSRKPVHFDRQSESRYHYLYRASLQLTGAPGMTVADFIPQALQSSMIGTEYLSEQLAALEHLADAPTARLERLFAEHIDLCSYRLDAWRWGLLNYQLAGLRYGGVTPGTETPVRRGVYVGVFGRVEQLKSEFKTLTPVTFEDPELNKIFDVTGTNGAEPLMRNNKNRGHIHAPSINHAVAAAILRNGYVENASSDNAETLKVNLSSERVRMAMGIIEGIRNGQKLGALLGYQFERGLHDRYSEAEVDSFIYEFRKAFPLVADKHRDTRSEAADEIRLVEARNVVDGYALVEHIRRSGQTAYPYGKTLPDATFDQRTVIEAEVDRIRDLADAVADLAMAEGVFQTVQGNFGRVASNLEAYAKGAFPPEPEVAQTPRSGIALTHRMGLQFQSGLDPAVSPNALAVTPRAFAEPAVNRWLNSMLPVPATVYCRVAFHDFSTDSPRQEEVTQANLALQPVDLLYLVNTETGQAMTALDDLIIRHVLENFPARWDVPVEITYMAHTVGQVSFFELTALLKPLRGLILRCRPLTAADVALPNEATGSLAETGDIALGRLSTPAGELARIAEDAGPDDSLANLLDEMAPLLADPVTNRGSLLAGIDGWIGRAVALHARAGRFSVTGSGFGFALEWKRFRLSALRSKIADLIARWTARRDRFDEILTVELPLANDDPARFIVLRKAEWEVSRQPVLPQPATIAAFTTVVTDAQDAFAARLTQFQAALDGATASVSATLSALGAAMPMTAFDGPDAFDLAAEEAETLRFAQDLADRAALLKAEIERRKADADTALAEAAAAGDPKTRVGAATKAAKTMFGEDFRIVPEFTLSEAQAGELDNAAGDSAAILDFALSQGRDFPVDDWLAGVARVREHAAMWEQVGVMAAALGKAAPELTALQLPYLAGDTWLGLEHPEDYTHDGERLLYTAHLAGPAFDAARPQCGLLLDEWTEVIPTREETTGVAFHFDRPNSEPPQTLMLALSPQLAQGWQWADLVDAVREAFDEARLRGVEPGQIDGTAYAGLLPATISAVTYHPLTIMLNLALNNAVFAAMETTDG